MQTDNGTGVANRKRTHFSKVQISFPQPPSVWIETVNQQHTSTYLTTLKTWSKRKNSYKVSGRPPDLLYVLCTLCPYVSDRTLPQWRKEDVRKRSESRNECTIRGMTFEWKSRDTPGGQTRSRVQEDHGIVRNGVECKIIVGRI